MVVRSEHGFSLIELLTVVSIIGVLSAIAAPQISGYKQRGFKARVESDLRHFATAEEAYFVDNETFTSCTNADCVARLPGVRAISQGVILEVISTGTDFTATATHPQLPEICHWDSAQEGFLGCT